MITLISPAKKLISISQPFSGETSIPLFVKETAVLAQLMKQKSSAEIGQLMDLSHDLSVLNHERYQRFNTEHSPIDHSYPALYLFQGDVYQGLQAKSWDKKAVAFSQAHLGILSGLYGMLRPLDLIQPYRLEMGIKLANSAGSTLYDYWAELITAVLNQRLSEQKNPMLINLASTEYFKAVRVKQIKYPVVTVNFYEHKNHETKMIGVYAKKARGLMAKYLMTNQIESLDELKQFNDLGYELNKKTSTAEQVDFIRTH